MVRSGRPRVVLSDAERTNAIHDVETILKRVVALEECLTIAAWRAGTNLSEWTDKRLNALREAANQLGEAVLATPADVD